MYWIRGFTAVLCLGLVACVGDREQPAPSIFLANYDIDRPTREALTYCTEHGCQSREILKLADAEWARISDGFTSDNPDSNRERHHLAQAIAYYEILGGRATGTTGDAARTSFNNVNQLDCIDETINSMSLIMVLEDAGLLRHHSLGKPVGRGTWRDWPHFGVTIEDTASGEIFVVDSWLRKNGEPPYILPLSQWKSGWNPA